MVPFVGLIEIVSKYIFNYIITYNLTSSYKFFKTINIPILSIFLNLLRMHDQKMIFNISLQHWEINELYLAQPIIVYHKNILSVNINYLNQRRLFNLLLKYHLVADKK